MLKSNSLEKKNVPLPFVKLNKSGAFLYVGAQLGKRLRCLPLYNKTHYPLIQFLEASSQANLILTFKTHASDLPVPSSACLRAPQVRRDTV